MAIIIGLYGISGSGKTHLLKSLEAELDRNRFAFYEGSDLVKAAVEGGLDAFGKLSHQAQDDVRRAAIERVRDECASSGKVGVVAGHFSLWSEELSKEDVVWTTSDGETFTHIIYLDVPSPDISHRRDADVAKSRPVISMQHLENWKQAEKEQMRLQCAKSGILFARVHPDLDGLPKVCALLEDFSKHTEELNLERAKMELDRVLVNGVQTALVFDGDKTLTADDTGELFWGNVCIGRISWDETRTSSAVFKGPLGYSYTAFRQVMLLFEEAADGQEFSQICKEVAERTEIYPDFVDLLREANEAPHIASVIVTCGLRQVWMNILKREGLAGAVTVIGNGRRGDDLIVTPTIKADLVRHLRIEHRLHVWTFGDSPLDLEMLMEADDAVVVVGREKSRSSSMETRLREAIDNERLNACQVLQPREVTPRLDRSKLPIVDLADPTFRKHILSHSRGLQLIHGTQNESAKLLSTPMRDASLSGPALRAAHQRTGWYLATEYVSSVLGLEIYATQHVQGHATQGYRLLHESHTAIVALMRGGHSMALGVSDAFPAAGLVCANSPRDLDRINASGRRNILLVDSVINTGKTIVEFVSYIKQSIERANIVVIAGVIQAEVVLEGGLLWNLAQQHRLKFVALRISENSFVGSGGTDTGNRLFNTTELE